MRILASALTIATLGALAPAAGAATPAEATLSLAAPTIAWSGSAAGYGVVVVNSLAARTCAAPACDEFVLHVAEAGDLAVKATANGASGFTELDIVRPDGTTVSNDGAAGQPTSEQRLKRVAPGDYLVRTHTNAPAFNDATYAGGATLSPSAAADAPPPPLTMGKGEGSPKDATVIAVIDSGFNPYHWDFLATRTPQALNGDPDDDLPLDRPASEWLPGYTGTTPTRVDLTLDESDPGASMDDLRNKDAATWAAFPQSSADDVKLAWFPRTKVIAAASFGGAFLGPNDAHGAGTTSVSAGNLHGTCPECLLVLLRYSDDASGEAAIQWAQKQPWIDVITNSYGFHVVGGYVRDNVYAGADTKAQKTAVQRGQTTLFSAGNGIENAFAVPNLTTFSAQKGPDWILTVGAVSPPEDGYYDAFTDDQTEEQVGPISGAGKPVDVASLGYDYPSAYYANAVGETGSIGFSGTSNATPVVAGVYARALYVARTLLRGTSRVQEDGVIAKGRKFKCGAARRGCELANGKLTVHELRTRLLEGAVPSAAGLTVAGQLVNPTLPRAGEENLMGEGHGAYLGRVRRDADSWLVEQDRVIGPLTGAAEALTRPAGERDWFRVRSYCRQQNWGAWTHGAYVDDESTPLPADSPAWPLRSVLARTCPGGPVPGS